MSVTCVPCRLLGERSLILNTRSWSSQGRQDGEQMMPLTGAWPASACGETRLKEGVLVTGKGRAPGLLNPSCRGGTCIIGG